VVSIVALVYLALEPALRSRWPHSIVTWNRVLAGRWSDAQVAASILIGAAVGSVLYIALNVLDFSRIEAGTLSPMGNLYQLLGVREWTASHAARLLQALRIGLIGFFVIFLLRALLKRELLAAGVAALLFTTTEGGVLNSPNWQIRAAVYALVFGILIFVMLRSGLLTTIAAVFFINSLSTSVSGTDFSAWHAPTTLASIVLWLAIAGWAFWRSMGNRELLRAAES
jgi:serine/threonine-protein kinase